MFWKLWQKILFEKKVRKNLFWKQFVWKNIVWKNLFKKICLKFCIKTLVLAPYIPPLSSVWALSEVPFMVLVLTPELPALPWNFRHRKCITENRMSTSTSDHYNYSLYYKILNFWKIQISQIPSLNKLKNLVETKISGVEINRTCSFFFSSGKNGQLFLFSHLCQKSCTPEKCILIKKFSCKKWRRTDFIWRCDDMWDCCNDSSVSTTMERRFDTRNKFDINLLYSLSTLFSGWFWCSYFLTEFDKILFQKPTKDLYLKWIITFVTEVVVSVNTVVNC